MVHVVKSKDPKVPPRIQLDPSWRPPRDPSTGALLPEGRLWEFTEKVAMSRREGKNRRDGATVSGHVLKLADSLGQQMFAEADEQGQRNKVPSRLTDEEARAVESKRRQSSKKRRGRRLEDTKATPHL